MASLVPIAINDLLEHSYRATFEMTVATTSLAAILTWILLGVGPDGLSVRRFIGTVVLPWSEVDSFDVRQEGDLDWGIPAFAVVAVAATAGGPRAVSLRGLPRSDQSSTQLLAAQLEVAFGSRLGTDASGRSRR